MARLWTVGILSLVIGVSAGAQGRSPSIGLALNWMELDNFQSALPAFTISQRVFMLYARGETQIETGFALRLAAGWGFAFEGSPLSLAHYETALALNFPFGHASAYVELGSGMMHFIQSSENVWRLTGWVGAGGRFSLFSKTSVFFEIMPLTLLDFSQPSLPWVWSYRGGVVWRF